jgi:hypothetical protein
VVGGERADVDAMVRECVLRSQGRRRSWSVGLQFVKLDAAARARLERALGPRAKGRA